MVDSRCHQLAKVYWARTNGIKIRYLNLMKIVECSIDGAVLEDLTEKDLDEELGIT